MAYQINLLSRERTDLSDRIIYFAFHYLRYILVVTQMVVIMVFFYRFQIDQEKSDLRESVRLKGEIIAVSAPLIRDVQAVEKKAVQIQKIVTQQTAMQSMYEYFFSTFPADLYLTKLTFENNTIVIEGYTRNVEMVRLYNAKLLQDGKFDTVILSQLSKTEANYLFRFTLSGFK